MQTVGRRYFRYINEIYDRSGTLWEGRFKTAARISTLDRLTIKKNGTKYDRQLNAVI